MASSAPINIAYLHFDQVIYILSNWIYAQLQNLES